MKLFHRHHWGYLEEITQWTDLTLRINLCRKSGCDDYKIRFLEGNTRLYSDRSRPRSVYDVDTVNQVIRDTKIEMLDKKYKKSQYQRKWKKDKQIFEGVAKEDFLSKAPKDMHFCTNCGTLERFDNSEHYGIANGLGEVREVTEAEYDDYMERNS